jgi:hypothetical protein
VAGIMILQPKTWFYCTRQRWLNGRTPAMGRDLDHFRKEGAKLVAEPTADDPYEDEAYRLWAIKQRSK